MPIRRSLGKIRPPTTAFRYGSHLSTHRAIQSICERNAGIVPMLAVLDSRQPWGFGVHQIGSAQVHGSSPHANARIDVPGRPSRMDGTQRFPFSWQGHPPPQHTVRTPCGNAQDVAPVADRVCATTTASLLRGHPPVIN